MKFKIDKGTETYQKITVLNDRINQVRHQIKDLNEEVGAEGAMTSSSHLAGFIAGFKFPQKPDGWKSASKSYPIFFPKSIRKNTPLLERIAAIELIDFKVLNEIVGFKPQTYCEGSTVKFIKSVGYALRDDYCLLSVSERAKFTPNADMVEILESEYLRLKGTDNE